MKIEINELQTLRNKSGLYFLYDNTKLVYIGYSSNIYQRVLEHSLEKKKLFDEVVADASKSDEVSKVSEAYLIHIIKPKYNKLVINDFKKWFFSITTLLSENISLDYIIETNKHYLNLVDINKLKDSLNEHA